MKLVSSNKKYEKQELNFFRLFYPVTIKNINSRSSNIKAL